MNDTTVIYLTASLIPESFAEYQRKILLDAIGRTSLISVSRKPLDFGTNLLDTKERSLSNIYFQMLRAAKVAETDYVAIAEDDCLYPRHHFKTFRPALDTFAYDMNRLLLFTWGEPYYSWKDRVSNATLIAPRKLLIESLEERFEKWPNGTPAGLTGELGRANIAEALGLKKYNMTTFYSDISTVVFNHDFASERWQREHKKKPGSIRSYRIPQWGEAKDQVLRFK